MDTMVCGAAALGCPAGVLPMPLLEERQPPHAADLHVVESVCHACACMFPPGRLR